MIELTILLALVVAAGIWIYNRLVRDRNQVRAAWSDIDVQLKPLPPAPVQAVVGLFRRRGWWPAILTRSEGIVR